MSVWREGVALPDREATWLAVEDGERGAINVGGWLLLPVPREEWIGELDGYWRSILRPTPLPNNEQSITLAGSQLG